EWSFFRSLSLAAPRNRKSWREQISTDRRQSKISRPGRRLRPFVEQWDHEPPRAACDSVRRTESGQFAVAKSLEEESASASFTKARKYGCRSICRVAPSRRARPVPPER